MVKTINLTLVASIGALTHTGGLVTIKHNMLYALDFVQYFKFCDIFLIQIFKQSITYMSMPDMHFGTTFFLFERMV